RARQEQDRCPRGPTDVYVREIERLFDIDRGAHLRETHDLRCLRRGDDDLTPLQRERDHDRTLLAAGEMAAGLVHDRGGRRCALERGEEALLKRYPARALIATLWEDAP